MKREYNTHSMYKLAVSLFAIILLIVPNNAIAADYVFEEDFSSEIGDWDLVGVDWSNYSVEGGKVINHSMSIKDGRLVSEQYANVAESGIWDHAFHPTSLENGVWEFKANQDNWERSKDLAWQFELALEDRTTDIWEVGGIIPPSNYTLTSILVLFEFDSIQIFEEKNGKELKKFYLRTDDFHEFEVDYTYTIVKNANLLSLFINQVKILEYTLLITSSTTFNHFGIGTSKPMNFDDFKVTDDLVNGVPIGDASSVPNSSNKDTNEGFLTFNQYLILAAITSVVLSYKYIFTKKKLKI